MFFAFFTTIFLVVHTGSSVKLRVTDLYDATQTFTVFCDSIYQK